MVVTFHLAPVPPFESHPRRATVDFHHLPRKGGHDTFEELVRLFEGAMIWAIVLIGGDECIVGTDFRHCLVGLCLLSVHEELVVAGVHRPKIFGTGLE